MNPLPLVRASLARNPFTVALFTLLIALAVALGLAISVQERALRQGSARAADRFDLIVAAPGSQTDLLFSTVFLRPSAVELLSPQVAAAALTDPDARLAAPIAFGDSVGRAPLVGTTAAFVDHLSGGLAEGRAFAALNEAVVGALVEARLGDRLEVRHGHADDLAAGGDADSVDLAPAAAAASSDGDGHAHEGDHAHEDHAHEDHEHEAHHGPDEAHEDEHQEDHGGDHEAVTITGRMRPTGTPWDRAVVVPVEYVWQAHVLGTGHAPGDTHVGAPWDPALLPGLPAIIMQPDSLAAAYGLRARYRTAASTAFFPAETLVDLYEVMGGAARVMSGLTLAAQVLVVAAILAGLLAVLDLQRQRFAVLRALGAPRSYVFLTVWLYVGAMIVTGAVLGMVLGWLASVLVSGMVSRVLGFTLVARIGWPEVAAVGLLVLVGLVLALIPALRIYRTPPVDTLR